MTQLEEYINLNFGVSGEELDNIAALFKPKVVSKGEFYIKSGAACDKLSFVQSGFLRLFATLDDKKLRNGFFQKDTLLGKCLALRSMFLPNGIYRQ